MQGKVTGIETMSNVTFRYILQIVAQVSRQIEAQWHENTDCCRVLDTSYSTTKTMLST